MPLPGLSFIIDMAIANWFQSLTDGLTEAQDWFASLLDTGFNAFETVGDFAINHGVNNFSPASSLVYYLTGSTPQGESLDYWSENMGSLIQPDDSDMASDETQWLDYISGLLASQKEENQIAREYNAEQAEISRKWQKDMADTQYQRAVADMKAAGLNPILAATKGFSANTPSGATASTSAGRGDTLVDVLSVFGSSVEAIISLLSKRAK